MNSQTAKSLFICVGDLSADRHTARLIAKLKETAPELELWGLGGPEMIAQGFNSVRNVQDFSVVGIVEVWLRAGFFIKLQNELLDMLSRKRPDAVLFVDCGAMNLRIAKFLRRRFPDLPLLYFISPQVWASRPWRIKTVKETITKMLVIFPFEEEVYRQKGVSAQFIGHPLTKNVPPLEKLQDRKGFHLALGAKPERHTIAIFPGSRKQEIKDLFPALVQAMKMLLAQRQDVQFVISKANARLAQMIEEQLSLSGIGNAFGERVFFVSSEENYKLMANADIVWAKSGTTTLEVTLFGKPMLIFYRGLWISFILFMLFKRVRRVGWPNLLAGRELVPELIQLDCRAELLVRYSNDLLDVPGLREEISKALLSLRDQLGEGDYATNCLSEIMKLLYPQPVAGVLTGCS